MTSGLVKDRQIKAELGEAGRRDQEGGAPAPSRAVAAQPGPSERVSRIAGQARWNTPYPRSGAPTFQPLRRARGCSWPGTQARHQAWGARSRVLARDADARCGRRGSCLPLPSPKFSHIGPWSARPGH